MTRASEGVGAGLSQDASETPVPPRPPRPTISDRLPRPWLFPLLVLAAQWAAILATWQAANLLTHSKHGWTWYFWYKDAGYYGEIARTWYAQVPWGHSVPDTAAFFPVFPAAIRACSFLAGGNIAVGGLIANLAAGAAALTGVWRLAGRFRDRWVADRAVLLFAAFPGAMTLAMMYSEPLGIALAVWCLLAVLDRRWITAGLLAAAGGAEHPTLIVLTPVLAIAALRAIATRPRPGAGEITRALIAPVLAPLGVLGYFAWIGHRWHDYLFWSTLERKRWGHHVDFGWHIYRILAWSYPHMGRHAVYFAMIIALLAVGVIGIALMLAARVPLPVSLFTLGVFASLVLSASAGPTPRYIWPMVGIFLGGAATLRRWLYWPLLVASAVILFFLVGWWPHHPMSPPP